MSHGGTYRGGFERTADREGIRHQGWRESGIQAIKQLPIVLIREINKKAGFMLLAKYGSKRALVTWRRVYRWSVE